MLNYVEKAMQNKEAMFQKNSCGETAFDIARRSNDERVRNLGEKYFEIYKTQENESENKEHFTVENDSEEVM